MTMPFEDSQIRKHLERRGIDRLIHFTRIENLESILKNGLVPVKTQRRKNIHSIRNDTLRLEALLDCTSLSISFPNFKLFYKFRQRTPGAKWVVLAIDTEALFLPARKRYFCYTNASALLPNDNDLNSLTTADTFLNMFSEETPTNWKRKVKDKTEKISNRYTTDPQAEVLISGDISSKLIKCVYFQSLSDVLDYYNSNDDTRLEFFDFLVRPGLFDKRYAKYCD